MLVFQNDETAANKFAYMLTTWVKTLYTVELKGAHRDWDNNSSMNSGP